MADTAPKRTPWLRYTILGLAGLQFAWLVLAALDYLFRSGSMDMITRSINRDLTLAVTVLFVLFTLPALILAIVRRWLWFALALALVPMLLVGALFAAFTFR